MDKHKTLYKATSREYNQQYRHRKKKQGWKAYSIFGPPPLITAIKGFVYQYHLDHMQEYERPHVMRKVE